MNEKQKKVKTAKCGAKAMPSGGTVMTRHDDDYDLWLMRNLQHAELVKHETLDGSYHNGCLLDSPKGVAE